MTVDQNRKLTDEQVREIHSLHPQVCIADIARKFEVARPTVHRILAGTTYRHVLHSDLPGRECAGPCCAVPKRAEANLRRINRHQVTVSCVLCSESVRVTTYGGQHSRGVVYCRDCNGEGVS